MPDIPALPIPSFMAIKAKPEQIGPPKSFMLYGPTGTRKTSAIGKLVASGRFIRVVYIDIDNGTEVFANDPEVFAAVQDGRISIIPIDTTTMNPTTAIQTIENVIFEIAGVWRTPQGHIEPNPNFPDFQIDLVVLDTLNLLQQVAVKHFMATTYNDRGNALDPRAAWGKVSTWTDEIVRLIHNSPRFTGAFVAHPKEVEEKNGQVKIKPQLQGSIKDTIASIPSLVAYLDWETNTETNADELVATVGESSLYESKNRYMLPSKIPNFSLVDLYDLIDSRKTTPAPAAAVSAPQVAAPAEPETTAFSGGFPIDTSN